MTRVAAICPVYNQREIIGERFANVMAQDVPLDVVWIDDASNDDGATLLSALIAGYSGPHRNQLIRNRINLGHGLSLFVGMATLEADIYIEFDDDVSKPERARIQVEQLLSDDKLMLVGCNYQNANARGEPVDSFESYDLSPCDIHALAAHRRLLIVAGHTFAWKAEIVRRFPSPRARISSGDFVVAFRAAMLGYYRFFPSVLVYYRNTPASVSRTPLSHGNHVSEARQYYRKRMLVFEGIAAQMEEDVAFASSSGIIDGTVATALLHPKSDFGYHLLSLRMVTAAAKGRVLEWLFAAIAGLQNRRLRPLARRNILLAIAPRLFYWAKSLLGRGK